METKKLSESEIALLAFLLAFVAMTDKTAPDPKNLRVGWWTDILLTILDKYVIGLRNDPVSYAEIARRARAQIPADKMPEITALLWLAEFRGERLLPLTPGREEKLTGMTQRLEGVVAALPDGTRKARCWELLLYHIGVFFDACGRFAEAADLQKRAAEYADSYGNTPGATVCRFLEAVYSLKQALVDGESAQNLNARLAFLHGMYDGLVIATRGTAMEDHWGKGNGCCHIIEACVWLNRNDHPNWDTWVDTALAAAQKLGDAWKPVAEFVRAVDMEKRNEQGLKDALLLVADDVGQDNGRRATALLVLARRHLINPGSELAAIAYATAKGFFADMPGQGAQHVIAAAKHELAEFERACKKEGT